MNFWNVFLFPATKKEFCPTIIAEYVEDIYQMYIESQEKGQLGAAMGELIDMNPLPMNTMLERQSKEEAIAKRTERKGKTVKDVPPTTAGNLNKILKNNHSTPAMVSHIARDHCSFLVR